MVKSDYNLVLMHQPDFQHIDDFLTVRNMMISLAQEIRTLIASKVDGKLQLPGDALKTINSLPTLIFSPTPLDLPEQFRGKRLIGQSMTKMKEYELLARENIPFPKSKHISTLADLDDLGEVVNWVKYESRTVDVERSMAEANFAPIAASSMDGTTAKMKSAKDI